MAARARTEVALLRGINVGGKHRLPMRELAAIFEAAGCTDVRTYIQSGNVVYRPPAGGRDLAALVAAEIERHFGFAAPVVTRSAAQLRGLPERNPFLRPGVDGKQLHVMFLAAKPRAAAARALDPDRSPPDELRLDGRELFLRLPKGVARTRFTSAYLDSTLETVGTGRNWATVCKLIELAG